jgi:acetyltransferase-like isoleucine patch superfamily enzyme
MNIKDVDLDEALLQLWYQLRELHFKLREHTWSKYRRVNPFNENLFEWREKGQFITGKDITIYDSTTVVGEVTIGNHSWIGPFCSLDGTGGLSIGEYCSISAGTHIQTHDTINWALSGGQMPYEYSPVRVGRCCFIGANAVITRGVTVGDQCLVAAGAVVTHDVPTCSIAAGVPARVIGHIKIAGDGSILLEYGDLT